MDIKRIIRVSRRTLASMSDDEEVLDEVLARIKADPAKAARWQHFAELCGNSENVPGAELDKAENDYMESVYMPTLLKVNLDIAKAMVIAARQEIANLEA